MISKQVTRLFEAMGLKYDSGYDVSPDFSTKPPRAGWQAVFFETESRLAIYRLATREKSISALRSFISGITTAHFIIVASVADHDCLFIKNFRRGDKIKYHTFPMRKSSEYNKAIAVLRKHVITTDTLTAHAGLANILKDMATSSESFTNRGLFSTYYLENRLFGDIARTKRNLKKEAIRVLDALRASDKEIVALLLALGYDVQEKKGGYTLLVGKTIVSSIIVTDRTDLDVKYDGNIPSMQAVSELSNHEWVMLTNGRIWRMYSSKVSSASTNYFEVDLDKVDDEKDMRLQYFVVIFGAPSMQIIKGTTQLDSIHEGSLRHASELEENMRRKIFEGEMFVRLVRGVLDHDFEKRYGRATLDRAKAKAMQILYRLLFILYAESRLLLPVDHAGYKKVSMLSMRDSLDSFQKDPESYSCWNNLKILFFGISQGNRALNLPEYNGKLFEVSDIDRLSIRNRFLVPVIRDMTEKGGESVDYQSLGVRHLGSIYESLLEYDVVQAEQDMVVVGDNILDADFASDMSEKPSSYVQKNDIYLSAGGLARKNTGGYFTPESIVKNLVKSGLQPIFDERAKKFEDAIKKYRNREDGAEERCNNLMLDLQVLDPAMGSGHFLVAVADEITRWIMRLVSKHPDAPVVDIIEGQRKKVIETQKKKGIQLNADLLTPNSVLKRMVMKNCVYGTDVNELSVELAKLSMWLDSFTIGMPLTVLGHHIRCGNALIGMHTSAQNDGTLDGYMEQVMESGGQILHEISQMPDIIPEEIQREEDLMARFTDQNAEIRRRFNAKCVHIMCQNMPSESEINATVDKHGIFHWCLEFPDAFVDSRPGFDLVVGNPPWEAVKPKDDEFFSAYDPHFRAHRSKQDAKKSKQKLLLDADVELSYSDYTRHIKEQSIFFKESRQYTMRGTGDIDLWKLFLERMMVLLADGGHLSVVMPSGILTNKGAKDLRKTLLNMRIKSIYEFENRRRIFPEVHASYKFVLLTVTNAKPRHVFHAAFYLRDVTSLDGRAERRKFFTMPTKLARLMSPELTIPEIRSKEDMEILNHIYERHGCVRDGLDQGKYSLSFVSEFHRTNDSPLFRRDSKGWPLIEGKNFHQFIPDFTRPEFTILPKEGLAYTGKKRSYGGRDEKIHDKPILAFRDVASSTNVRTMISCVVAPRRFFSNSSPIIIVQHNRKPIIDKQYNKITLYLAALFNSMTFDYLIRAKTNMHLNFFIVNGVAIPDDLVSERAECIIRLAGMLTMQDESFEGMAEELGTKTHRLSMEQKIKVTAELDALVAHHYGLDRKQYEHIVGTFGSDGNIATHLSDDTKWNDATVRAFNLEVQKHAMTFYDKYISGQVAE